MAEVTYFVALPFIAADVGQFRFRSPRYTERKVVGP
jgi:hypothetical protein